MGRLRAGGLAASNSEGRSFKVKAMEAQNQSASLAVYVLSYSGRGGLEARIQIRTSLGIWIQYQFNTKYIEMYQNILKYLQIYTNIYKI